MPLKIPNESAASFPIQAEPDAFDLEALVQAHQASGVVAGCTVIPFGGMAVTTTPGGIKLLNVNASFLGGNLTLAAAHPTLNRFDLLCAKFSTSLPEVVQGASAVEPEFPIWENSNRVLLAAIYIPAGLTTIAASHIVDKRVIIRANIEFGPLISQIDIGDSLFAGFSGSSADSQHEHAFPAPGVAYAADVAAAKADGTATTPARSDHAHAHGVGYLPDAHHGQSHVHLADGSGIVAHGSLSGLTAGDEHTQYILKSLLTTRGDIIRRGAAIPERLALGADGTALVSDGTDIVYEAQYYTVNFIIDGGGVAITAGVKADVELPSPGVIEEWRILADTATGNTVVDVQKAAYAGFPTFASIAGTEKPTLTGVDKNSDDNLTTWTTAVLAEDILRFIVDSNTTKKLVTVALKIRKT